MSIKNLWIEKRGFSLIELSIITAVLGVLSMMMLPSFIERIEAGRISEEQRQQLELVTDIQRSFRETDWARNLAALPGNVPAAIVPTRFSNPGLGSIVARDTDWFVKLGRLRGIMPMLNVEISEDRQPSLFELVHNGVSMPRYLVRGPVEPGQQRYIIFSIVAPPSVGLVVPPDDGTAAWFDAIWNHAWEGASNDVPSEWIGRLTPEQLYAWRAGRGSTTRSRHFVMRRIVQPKHTVIVNNTHPTYTAWLDFDGVANALEVPPSAGVRTTGEILAGRQVVVRRGVTAPGVEAYRFYLNEASSVSVQP